MMSKKNIDKAKAIIEKIDYITLATVTSEGKPWNSPVYASHDDEYTFYWLSWKENQHSKNIRTNGDVFIVIYDSTASQGGGGVYLQAKAYELTEEKDILNALFHLYGRQVNASDAVEFQSTFPRRVYKAVHEKVWVNEVGKLDGNFVDKRIEIQLR